MFVKAAIVGTVALTATGVGTGVLAVAQGAAAQSQLHLAERQLKLAQVAGAAGETGAAAEHVAAFDAHTDRALALTEGPLGQMADKLPGTNQKVVDVRRAAEHMERRKTSLAQWRTPVVKQKVDPVTGLPTAAGQESTQEALHRTLGTDDDALTKLRNDFATGNVAGVTKAVTSAGVSVVKNAGSMWGDWTKDVGSLKRQFTDLTKE